MERPFSSQRLPSALHLSRELLASMAAEAGEQGGRQQGTYVDILNLGHARASNSGLSFSPYRYHLNRGLRLEP
jgi:hypothetical protein